MEPSPTPEPPMTRIRVSEALRTAGATPVPSEGADLEIAFYPDRIARPSDPLQLSPSQALRFTDDPGRMAAAAQTARSRTTVTSPAAGRHPQPGESDTPRHDAPAEAPPREDREAGEADIPQVRDAPAAHHSPAEPGPDVAPRTWSVPLEVAPPPRRGPWWRRLLGLGDKSR
jgi:hypothetical protein